MLRDYRCLQILESFLLKISCACTTYLSSMHSPFLPSSFHHPCQHTSCLPNNSTLDKKITHSVQLVHVCVWGEVSPTYLWTWVPTPKKSDLTSGSHQLTSAPQLVEGRQPLSASCWIFHLTWSCVGSNSCCDFTCVIMSRDYPFTYVTAMPCTETILSHV